jgi:hypothetical protein
MVTGVRQCCDHYDGEPEPSTTELTKRIAQITES